MRTQLSDSLHAIATDKSEKNLIANAKIISTEYESANAAARNAIQIANDGKTTVDVQALTKVLMDVAPLNSKASVQKLVADISAGYILDRTTPIAPGAFFTDAAAVSRLDDTAWEYFGFAGRQPNPFASMKNVPAEVMDRRNLVTGNGRLGASS